MPVSVINADSRQVYRDFPLITAQPSQEEQARCPHLLYGFLRTERKLGAGEFARAAHGAIADARAGGRAPLLVGGTGLYYTALLEGIAPIPAIPAAIAAAWQRRCDEEGSPALHALLAAADPVYAAKIHPNDKQRVTRALEVLEGTGKPFSWWHARPLPPPAYASCKVGIWLPMRELEELLARRIESMLAAGALEEGRAALETCADPGAPGWSGIGCAEVYRYLSGELSIDECKALWFTHTRAYAKRQNTWFRADTSIRWFAPHQTREIREYVLCAMQGDLA